MAGQTSQHDSADNSARPFLGHGVGLRVQHYNRVFDTGALNAETQGIDVDWVEVVTENFFGAGGRPRAVLDHLSGQLPIVLHGVSMGIGSPEPVSQDYLHKVRSLIDRYNPPWVSDHLCWGKVNAHQAHDLLPLPYTNEAVAHVVGQLHRVQDALGRPLVLENVSSYVTFSSNEMTEWEFLTEVSNQAGSYLLVDLNNVIVSAKNFDFDPKDYLLGIPPERIYQYHLANHCDRGHYKFDSHKGPVPQEVWDLYKFATQQFGAISTLIEWDEDVPAWEELRQQQRQAKNLMAQVLAEGSSDE